MAEPLARKVIRIRAEDSPNVRRGVYMQSLGLKPDNLEVTKGVLPFDLYQHRRATWDIIQQTVGLDAQWYVGKELMLFPPEWYVNSERLADRLVTKTGRKAKGIGIDPAEGGDMTSYAVVDDYGLLDLISMKTPDTKDVYHQTIALINKWQIPPEKVCIDRGGGGKQHADYLRAAGYPVESVGFGEKITVEPKRGIRLFREKVETREESYIYYNRRAQLYGTLSELMDPGIGFAIPRRFSKLREQLLPIPKRYEEGRLKLPPKRHADGNDSSDRKEKSLIQLIGYSPDEADALTLAVHAMLYKKPRTSAGAI